MGAFSFLMDRLGENPPGFDKFAGSKFGQPQAGPVARSAEGLGAWMHPTIPLVHKTSVPLSNTRVK